MALFSALDNSPGSTAFSIATTAARASRVPSRTRIWSPFDSGLSCSQKIRARRRLRDDVAALDEQLTVERDADRSSGTLPALDRRDRPALHRPDLRDLARRHDHDLIAGREIAGLDAARDDAAVVEFVD